MNNPYLFLETEAITKAMLSPKASKMLELYDRAQLVAAKHPNSKELGASAKKAGELATDAIKLEAKELKKAAKNEIEENYKTSVKKKQSKIIVEKSEQTLDDLELCRQKLREHTKRQRESGEIPKPKKKTLTTKLRLELGRIVGLIPAKLKEDTNVIARTEKAMLKFLNELKAIWGMDKIKPIEDEIIEKINKLRDQAA